MHRVLLRPPAQRFLRKLRDRSLTARLVAAMRALASQPRPPGCDKLAGPENLYRIRVGDFRIVYQIRDEVLLVLVVKIGHRREVYR
ncbi:MAG TPA: type II toxin-antitoxin system RelE/ParE family toxin [Verrucomicrobiota bacterium]|jgi:mRNA interferase RelE/StbE|nr:type II toxin-antitoxin system RelE/ParE family toxin [Verrucomicrobiota bacterium]HQL79379.1 type II toxin-antitoxin system RelE/ParE family toxin [Verrucomicrobiota bacterium]